MFLLLDCEPGPACLAARDHHGGNPWANLKSISHRCHPILVAFVWELTKETSICPWVASRVALWCDTEQLKEETHEHTFICREFDAIQLMTRFCHAASARRIRISFARLYTDLGSGSLPSIPAGPPGAALVHGSTRAMIRWSSRSSCKRVRVRCK